MKRLITILLSIALLVMAAGCAGGNTEPTERETTPTKQDTTEATVPAKVTVYLLDKVTTDYGDYTVYFYDENYNVDYCEQLDQSNTVSCTTYFEQKDINGMAGELREVWDSGTQYICALTWSQDGKLLKKAEDLAKTELEFEYDGAGKLVEVKEYYDGGLSAAFYYEYEDEVLQRLYCINSEEMMTFECETENGKIVKKTCYYDGGTGCCHDFLYDENGNLVEQREYWEDAPNETTTIGYSYKAVEVDADRAPYILAQQKYLVSE